MMRAAYPGTFDPFTRGHLDIACRAAALFDELVVAVGADPSKRTLFTPAERVEIARAELADAPNVRVEGFEGLLVEFLQSRRLHVVVRGLRSAGDFEREQRMAEMNRALLPGLEVMYLAARPEYACLNAHLIREVAALGGPAPEAFVSPRVAERLRRKVRAGGG